MSVGIVNRRTAVPLHTKKHVSSTKFAVDTDQGCEYEGRNAFATSKIKKNKCGKKADGLSLPRKLLDKPHGMYDK